MVQIKPSLEDDVAFSVFPAGYNWGGVSLMTCSTKFQGWIMTQIIIGLQRAHGWSGMEGLGNERLKSLIRECQDRAAQLLEEIEPPCPSASDIVKFTHLHRLRNAIINFASERMRACFSESHPQGS